MRSRPGFLLPKPPDVLGALVEQSELVAEATVHLERWGRTGDPDAAAAVAALRPRADALAEGIIDLLFDALVTPIDREDAATLVERLRLGFRALRGLVREAQALDVATDRHLARMSELLAGQARAVVTAMESLPRDRDTARTAVEIAEAADHELDEVYRAAMSDTVRRTDPLGVVFGSRELYRRAVLVSQAQLHTAHFARYVVLKES